MFKKIQELVNAVFRQEYAKASIYYVVANVIGQGIVLFSSAFFTRMMSKNDFGLVSAYSTWVLVINTFVCLNLFVSVRNAYIDFNDDYDNFNSSVLTMNILAGIVITVLISIITVLIGRATKIQEILLACIQAVALNIVNFMMAVQAMKNEYRQRVVFMVLPSWTHITMSILLMLIFTQNLYMAKIVGNAFGLLVFGVAGATIIYKHAAPKINLKYWKYALNLSLPSIFYILADLILMQCDRLMLKNMIGSEETAEYSIVYNVSSIIVIVNQSINGAWTPWFFTKMANNERGDIIRYQKYYLFAFTLFTFGMMTISPELIKILSPRSYWDGIRYMSPIVVASYFIFLYTFFTIYMMYKKQPGKIAKNVIIVAVLNIMLNYIIIPQCKSLGAVLSTVVSYMMLLVLNCLSAGKDGRKFFSFHAMWLGLLAVCAYGMFSYFMIDKCVVRYVFFVILTLAVYIIKGKSIIQDFKRI